MAKQMALETKKKSSISLMNLMLLAVPASIVAEVMHFDKSLIFILACLGIVPLAGILGEATEEISKHVGSKIGGLLNATMGNVPELIIGIFAIKAGLLDVVKASIVGSIMGNLLLVLGFSLFLGGLKYPVQNFNRAIARSNFTMMVFALVGLSLPLGFAFATKNVSESIQPLSIGIAIILLCVYVSGLVFSLYTHKNIFTSHDEEEEEEEEAKWSAKKAFGVLAVATFFIAIESEMLVGSIESIVHTFGLSEIFIGIIVVPIVGNVAEHTSAIIMAMKNKVDISIEIAAGSGMQIALFVAPLLVLSALLFGQPLNFLFSGFEMLTVAFSVFMSLYICQDGKTNWMEGLQLLMGYVLIGVTYFFI